MSEGMEQSELSKNKDKAVGLMAAVTGRAILYNECTINIVRTPRQNKLHAHFSWDFPRSYSLEIVYGDGGVSIRTSTTEKDGGGVQVDLSRLHRVYVEDAIAGEVDRINTKSRSQKATSE